MDNEEQNIASGNVTVSDNEKGNKLHSKKDGKFVGKNGEQGLIDSDLRKELLNKVVLKRIQTGGFGQRIFDTYNRADENNKQALIDAIVYQLEQKATVQELKDDRNVNEYTPVSAIDTQGLDSNQRKMALLQDTRLSKSAILNASDEEIEQLLEAAYLFDSKTKQIGENPEIVSLKNNPKAVINNVWMTPMTLDDYQELKKNGRIDAKIYYFQNNYGGTDKDTILQNINDYCDLGEQYVSILNSQNLDTTADQAIMEKFSNPDSPYSWKRKHKDAVYNDVLSSSFAALQATNKKYGAETNNMMRKIYKIYGQDGLDIIADYTHGFVWANDPLRKMYYSVGGGSATGTKRAKNWLTNINLATDVIGMCSYNDDMWLTRGSDYLGDQEHGINLNNIKNINDLVGMVFGDQGFVSSSASKINYTNKADNSASQFKNSRVIQHIYAPKGTHMIHTSSLATSNHNLRTNTAQDNNDYSRQNEFLIQRGYSYRITKAYQQNGQIHVDCEVILDSDSQKYDQNELQMIERMYVN